MANGSVVGTVSSLMISRVGAFVDIVGSDRVNEKLLLWGASHTDAPDEETRVIWVGLCQNSLANGNEVLVTTDAPDSASVVSIQMSARLSLSDSILAAIDQLL